MHGLKNFPKFLLSTTSLQRAMAVYLSSSRYLACCSPNRHVWVCFSSCVFFFKVWNTMNLPNITDTQFLNSFHVLPWRFFTIGSQTTQHATHTHTTHTYTRTAYMYTFCIQWWRVSRTAIRNFLTRKHYKSSVSQTAFGAVSSQFHHANNCWVIKTVDSSDVRSFLTLFLGDWNYVLTYQQGPENSQWRHNTRALSVPLSPSTSLFCKMALELLPTL